MAPRVGIVGDFNASNPTHRGTTDAFAALGFDVEWIATDAITEPALGECAGLVIAPGSPYRSMDGALAAIRHARTRGVPLIATWGGFQHAIVEIARNVLGFRDADHAESNPSAARAVVTPLVCSLAGQTETVSILPDTIAARLYGASESRERYYCNYGLNPEYRAAIERTGLRTSGVGENGEVRIAELVGHPFFMATLFLPQMAEQPHPLLTGFAAAMRSRT